MARETRICGTCGNPIIVNRQNINNIAYYQGYHHHVECLADKANKGIESGKRIAIYQRLLDKIPELQAEARRRLEHSIIRDEFNDYLLANYDVCTVSERFWHIVEDIGNGNYKRKKCKAVDMQTLMDTWKWGQKKLNKIAANNKVKNKGPQNDEQRLNYDLAIILQHVGDYQKHIIQTKEEKVKIIKHTENKNKIDYEKLYSQSQNQGQADSILDLMNEIF